MPAKLTHLFKASSQAEMTTTTTATRTTRMEARWPFILPIVAERQFKPSRMSTATEGACCCCLPHSNSAYHSQK